jgi:hypothetical protein
VCRDDFAVGAPPALTTSVASSKTLPSRSSVRFAASRRTTNGPFGGQVGEASNPHAMRQPPVDSRLDEVSCKEGKRDRHIHFSDTALFPLRDGAQDRDETNGYRRRACEENADVDQYARKMSFIAPPAPAQSDEGIEVFGRSEGIHSQAGF